MPIDGHGLCGSSSSPRLPGPWPARRQQAQPSPSCAFSPRPKLKVRSRVQQQTPPPSTFHSVELGRSLHSRIEHRSRLSPRRDPRLIHRSSTVSSGRDDATVPTRYGSCLFSLGPVTIHPSFCIYTNPTSSSSLSWWRIHSSGSTFSGGHLHDRLVECTCIYLPFSPGRDDEASAPHAKHAQDILIHIWTQELSTIASPPDA